MDFSAEWHVEGSVGVCKISGEIDVSTAAILRDELVRVLDLHPVPTEIELNFDDVTFIDSAGLTALGDFRRRFLQTVEPADGAAIRISGAGSRMLRIFAITGLDQHFEIEP